MKADFHTHTVASPDGALTAEDIRRVLAGGILDVIAVTDHNTTDFAQELHAQLGEHIIVGEEITTLQGEVIGLYLQQTVPAGLTLPDTLAAIHAQGGLVYVPHPFETVRQGVSLLSLDAVADQIDIVEIHNGRAIFQNKSRQARQWAAAHNVVGAASSDAHGIHGWGRTYTTLSAMPSKDTLISLLATATYDTKMIGARGMLYPKLNRLRKRVRT
jgi:hypothetical protein